MFFRNFGTQFKGDTYYIRYCPVIVAAFGNKRKVQLDAKGLNMRNTQKICSVCLLNGETCPIYKKIKNMVEPRRGYVLQVSKIPIQIL